MKSITTLTHKFVIITMAVCFSSNIAKAEIKVKSEHLYNCAEVGYLHYDLSLDGEVTELRADTDKHNVAFSLNYKKKDDSIQTIFAAVNIDSRKSELIDEERFRTFTSPQSAGELTCKAKLEQFVEGHFKPHPGVLGGTVHYDIANWFYSLDKNKVAFIVEGTDGHKVFYPTLFMADKQGNNITRVDSSSRTMCADVIWISDSEIIYSKDNVLWRVGYNE